ncbi:MAG: hypothetical protein GXP31_04990 [Kiritimatiellaeota bacterium]|nr:hypothetical protein [Kiritimatiellota bacterium]
MSQRLIHRFFVALLVSAVSAPGTSAQRIDAQVQFYSDGAMPDCRFRPWGMAWREQHGGVGAGGKCLWFNFDWKARPWAGATFQRIDKTGVKLDRAWIERGFVRFYVNGGPDRYGFLGGGVELQLRPAGPNLRYQHLRSRFVGRGRGFDEDPATWQEVLVPLSFWTDLKEGQVLTGVHIQCRGEPVRAFGLDEVAFVRLAKRPEWLTAKPAQDAAQPWVKWPKYDDLPDTLKADQHPPKVVNGRFVWPDGQRVFILNPYCREDPRIDLWGTTREGECAPNHGLYDPNVHGWIYRDLPTAQSLCRLGFNSYSATMPPVPWWRAVGYKREDRGASAERLPGFYKRVKLPFYVDMVAWPWTLGAPNSPKVTNLSADTFTQGRQHWTPYRIIGKGSETWLALWRLYARRYRDAGVPVLIFELMNEPAYVGLSNDHRAEFVDRLKQRYRSLDRLNRVWRTEFASWGEAANIEDERELKKIPGRFFDYDEYLADRFTELIARGVGAVTEILPNALVGVQTMGGYAMRPREAVWKYRFVKHETVVLTPTGGGRWTSGYSCANPPASLLDGPIAPAPIENDLLLALADTKMIYDNETYLRGQTATEVRNRLWEQVVAGLDGLTVFSWSKRGWAWWGDRAKVQTEADKFPYSNLNPLARRTEALRGIHDFAREVQPLADRILRKPWGPKPAIALLYDWAQARWMSLETNAPDKTRAYYAALKYTHWNFGLVPSDRAMDGALRQYDVLVMGGVAHIEREMLPVLEAFVRAGGVLVVGEEPFNRDLYGRELSTAGFLGVDLGKPRKRKNAFVRIRNPTLDSVLPGAVRITAGLKAARVLPGADVVMTDDAGAPVVTRKRLGKGVVFFQAADVVGYSLAKVLWAILADAASFRGPAMPSQWRLAEVRNAADGQLATNVLLSRRSYPTHHALLLMNRDAYDKRIVIRLAGLSGRWRVTDALDRKPMRGPNGPVWSGREISAGVPLSIKGGHPAVIILELIRPVE